MLRHTYVTTMLDAGVDLRDVQIAARHADPRTTSVIAGSRLDFLEALEALSVDHPALVEPLLLRDIQELEYADIAELLDIPVGTVKSRIHSARRIVQPLLAVR